MTPTIVHRYAVPVREAIEALIGDAAGDAEGWQIRIDGADVVIDLVEPMRVGAPVENERAGADIEQDQQEIYSTAAEPVEERKGGNLARRAAMLCQERGFQTFSETETIDEAASWLRERCGVESRAELDHDERAAAAFESVDGRYRRWLQGYDD